MAGSEAAICSSAKSSGRYSLCTGRRGSASTAIQARGGSWKVATAALWTEQRPSFGDWAMETRQGVSCGGGVGDDGRVAPSGMARFCADGRRCVQCSIGKGRLWTGKRPPNGDWATETRHCVSRGVGVTDGRVAPSRVAQFCSDGRGAASETWPPCGRDSAPRLEVGQQKSGRAPPVCGALLTISDQSGHMLVHQS